MKYLLLFLLLISNAQAIDLDIGLQNKLHIHGFASQNYIHTSDNNFFGKSDNMGSLDFTEIGFNSSLQLARNINTAMQVLYRRAGATDAQYARIDFAFVDLNLFSNMNSRAGIRGGRVINPYGLYNDTRDMPFTRPSILLPQSIYFDINRNFALSGDGIQGYSELNTNYGEFTLQLNGMYPRVDDPEWHPTLQTSKLSGQPSYIGRLLYAYGEDTLRAGISFASFNIDFSPLESTKLTSKLNFEPILFSFQYNLNLFTFTTEYAIRPTLITNNNKKLINFIGESYYFQGSFKVTPDIEVYSRYDLYFSDRSDKDGKIYESNTGLPGYLTYAKDITTGIRWDVNQNIMLRAEYHYVNGAGYLSFIENKDLPNISKYWNMIIFGVSFRI
jgi:hypothetical protein